MADRIAGLGLWSNRGRDFARATPDGYFSSTSLTELEPLS
jgi:hypothetical protein